MKVWRKRIAVGIGFIAISILVIAAAGWGLAAYQLPETEYKNGEGQAFSLRFYRNATTEAASSLAANYTLPGYKADTDDRNFLVAGPADEYPIILSITKSEGKSIYESEQLCAYPPLTIEREGETNDVCTFGTPLTEVQPVYFYEFTSNNQRYFVYISKDFPEGDLTVPGFEGATQAEIEQPTQATELYEKTDLRPHNDDIKLILSSIEVL